METARDFEGLWNRGGGSLALEQVAGGLNGLRMVLRDEAPSVEQDIALAQLALAEDAALCADGARMLEHLHDVGRGTLDRAERINASLAAAAIRTSRQS